MLFSGGVCVSIVPRAHVRTHCEQPSPRAVETGSASEPSAAASVSEGAPATFKHVTRTQVPLKSAKEETGNKEPVEEGKHARLLVLLLELKGIFQVLALLFVGYTLPGISPPPNTDRKSKRNRVGHLLSSARR